MKKTITAALALASCAAFGITGREAAALITSEPSETYYVQPESFAVNWTYYDGGQMISADFSISANNWETDIEAALNGLKGTVNSLALNSFEALAKIAALNEVDRYLSSRIDALTDSLKGALAQLDEVKQEDDHGNKTTSKVEVHNDYVTLVGGGAPVDGVSVSYTGTATNSAANPIEVHGFKGAKENAAALPHPQNGELAWSDAALLLDNKSLGYANSDYSTFSIVFQLKGWDDPTTLPNACFEELSDLLRGAGDAANHYVLTRYKGDLHYTPIGRLAATQADNYSIVTNAAGGLAIAGLDDAEDGEVLTFTANGVAWTQPVSVPAVDGKSIVTNGGELAIAGFADAAVRSMPYKDEDGTIKWDSFASSTNIILAGAGINITDNGGGAITISAQALEGQSGSGAPTVSVSVVTDARYDSTSHKFQIKRRTIVFSGSLGTESGWEDVFEAASHQSEHDNEEEAER